jgi:membrane protein implicated in regulation of membrane protease activity
MNTDWWSSLDIFAKFYWLIAIPSSLAFLIQLVLTFIGGDFDGDADIELDAEIEGDSGIGFQFFTLKNLIAFFAIFSWVGLACIDAELSKPVTILLSSLSGIAMMLLMASIFYFASKLTESGTLKMANAIGHIGDVYLTIPANSAGYGKVQIKLQGALRELDAITHDSENIPTGAIIKVTNVSPNNILIVTKN